MAWIGIGVEKNPGYTATPRSGVNNIFRGNDTTKAGDTNIFMSWPRRGRGQNFLPRHDTAVSYFEPGKTLQNIKEIITEIQSLLGVGVKSGLPNLSYNPS